MRVLRALAAHPIGGGLYGVKAEKNDMLIS